MEGGCQVNQNSEYFTQTGVLVDESVSNDTLTGSQLGGDCTVLWCFLYCGAL